MTKPHPNETIKANSRALRGGIAEGLRRPETGALAEDDTQLTKFHGIYQQDDRDLRAERGRQKMEKAFSFMARLRVPGGVLTPAQFLAAARVGRQRANGTLRLTTRQTIQFHGILKGNLRPALQALHAELLDSIAACGDVNRNVIATADPWRRALHAEAAALADAIASHLLPASRAWHEIWIDGAPLHAAEPEPEPIYGRTYLPRKFKIAIALPPHNDVDVFAHDLGFIGIVEDGRIAGYNVVIGGGMGMTHGEPDTFPRAGDVIGFCPPGQAVAVAEQVVILQRDHGDRASRKHARLKYTVERLGLDHVRALLNARLATPLAPARPYVFTATGDRPGWAAEPDGTAHVTLFIENGRLVDRPGRAVLAGLEAVAGLGIGRFVLTPNQNLVIADIPPGRRATVAALLAAHGLDTPAGPLRRNAIACVALPTCGLALAESERYLPELVTALEARMVRAGLAEDEITIRMTGCPNGCARPYLAEIALVGRAPGTYNLYLGGAFQGTRLNKLYRRDLGHDAIVAVLGGLFDAYAAGRAPGERFGDFVIRAEHVQETTAGRLFHADLPAEAAA
ncbi:MAG: sulfite reductase subunit beta [Rhodospirillales bacterium 70-18]|nr:MAG: sulfite reductase subunit beta [Rhodospirillales bacterium 70-18]